MNIVKGVADLLRKSAPASPGGGGAGGGSGGGAGEGGGGSPPSADRLAVAPSPRVRFRYATQPARIARGSFCCGECDLLV